METAKPVSRIHPLVAVAAVAVTLVSLAGVAAITGLLPSSNISNSAGTPQQIVGADSTAQASPLVSSTSQPPAKPSAPVRSSGQAQQSNNDSPVKPTQQVCSNCGQIEAVRAVTHTPKASGVGVLAGAVLGGVLGNQVGSGNGRTLATVAGAGAGGFAGNEVEKRSRTTTSYVVDVRMENGHLRSFPQTSEGWRAGDQVRVVNNHLTSRS